MYKYHNAMTNEDIVVPRLVNQQSLDFNELCEYLADGSTVTAADVSAVMKQIEMRLPLVLGLNAKVVCSPEGLTFRPKVSGSITQSELKAKLEAKKAAETDPEKAALIDVDRALALSDLKATFKRITKTSAEAAEETSEGTDNTDSTGGDNTGGNTQSGGTDNTGGGSTMPGEGD